MHLREQVTPRIQLEWEDSLHQEMNRVHLLWLKSHTQFWSNSVWFCTNPCSEDFSAGLDLSEKFTHTHTPRQCFMSLGFSWTPTADYREAELRRKRERRWVSARRWKLAARRQHPLRPRISDIVDPECQRQNLLTFFCTSFLSRRLLTWVHQVSLGPELGCYTSCDFSGNQHDAYFIPSTCPLVISPGRLEASGSGETPTFHCSSSWRIHCALRLERIENPEIPGSSPGSPSSGRCPKLAV